MPIKKLKLIKKPLTGITNSLTTVVNGLEECSTSNDVVKLLLSISGKFEVDPGEISEVVRKLR